MFQIIWSPLARQTYLDILTFTIEQWSLETALELDEEVTTLLDKLIEFHHLCPPSIQQPDLYKCTITKQTSMVYEVKDDTIQLIAFFDNRSDHPY